MLILTPDPQYRFTTRDGSPSDEAVIREMWAEDVYQLRIVNLDGATLVDIGANIGAVSVWAASQGARVIAVEPEPDNLKYLRMNIADNGVDVTVDPVAVSDQAGTGFIAAGHGHSQLADTGTEVAVCTLAELLDRNNVTECVLKVDIEGSEYPLIAGADIDTLKRVTFLTLEFDSATDEVFGAMIAKVAKVFNTHILGSPERGGYIYGHRY